MCFFYKGHFLQHLLWLLLPWKWSHYHSLWVALFLLLLLEFCPFTFRVFFSFPPQQPHTKKTHSVCTHSLCLIMLFIIFHFSFKKAISTLISPVKSHCDSYATLKWCALSFSLSFLSLCIFQELPAPKRKIRAGTRSEEGTRKATRRRPSTCSVRRDRTVSDTETTTFFYQIWFWEQNKS